MPFLSTAALAVAVMPNVALRVENPAVDLPKVVIPLEWLGRADPRARPSRFRRWGAKNLGIRDLFDPGLWRSIGVDVTAPIHLMSPPENGPLIVELAVADAAKLDAWMKSRARSKPLPSKQWTHAVEVRPPGQLPILIARVKKRVVLHELPDYFEVGERVRRPKPRTPGPVTVVIQNVEQIARADLAVAPSEGQIEVRGSVRPSFVARMMTADLIQTKPSRRTLVGVPAPAAVLVSAATPNAVRQGLIEAGMPSNEANRAQRLFAGEHSVALTIGGSLIGVMRLSGSASEQDVSHFSKRITELQPGLQVRRAGAFLLGWFPGKDASAVTSFVDGASEKVIARAPRAKAALELQISGTQLMSALRRRARVRVGPAIGLGRLTLAEALYGPLLRSLETGTLRATRRSGAISIEAKLTLR